MCWLYVMCWLGTETLKTFKTLKTPVSYFARLWKETFKYYRARCGVCVLWLYGYVSRHLNTIELDVVYVFCGFLTMFPTLQETSVFLENT